MQMECLEEKLEEVEEVLERGRQNVRYIEEEKEREKRYGGLDNDIWSKIQKEKESGEKKIWNIVMANYIDDFKQTFSS